jgi:glycosyltransferase involved in cell wall biosynthesis
MERFDSMRFPLYSTNFHPVAVIIPAVNEEQSIGKVLRDIPSHVQWVIVADNGSTDGTARAAREQGAQVVSEPRRGYGCACLRGIANLPAGAEIVVFMDGDYSDYPAELNDLVSAMVEHQADLVIGSRVLGKREKGSLTVQQRFGNWLSTRIIRFLYGFSYTDLGPFRAIRTEALQRLKMQDLTYGWTVEMQVKALQYRMKVVEVPVRYRKRIGKSKVSGTISGSVMAGAKILWTIGKLAMKNPNIRHRG